MLTGDQLSGDTADHDQLPHGEASTHEARDRGVLRRFLAEETAETQADASRVASVATTELPE